MAKVDRYECFYCGEPADTVDHQPPISRVDDYRSQGLERQVYIKVPSCFECNRLISDELTTSIFEREKIVKSYLYHRYRKVLSIPKWTREELDSLGDTLRESVEESQRQREWVEERLSYTKGISTYLESL